MAEVIFNVRDAQRRLTYSLAESLGGILGYVDVDNAVNPNGSINVPELAFGEPFEVIRPGVFEGGVSVTFNGTQMTWTQRRFRNGQLDIYWRGRIYYGTV